MDKIEKIIEGYLYDKYLKKYGNWSLSWEILKKQDLPNISKAIKSYINSELENEKEECICGNSIVCGVKYRNKAIDHIKERLEL